MITRKTTASIIAVLSVLLFLPAILTAEEAEKQDPKTAPVLTPAVEGYMRVMPRFYLFRGDQGYLQRYQALDPKNENALDRILDSANEFALFLRRPGGGAPYLELMHTNPFLINDQWDARLRPATGIRFDLGWRDYQRPFEKFLPTPSPDTFSYAKQFNDDMLAQDDLRRRRGDLAISARFEPAAWSDALGFARGIDFDYSHSRRRGFRQYNWIFGVVEDLVVPAGNNPSRWRGRTEELEQAVDRYSVGSTLVLGKGNITRLKVYGERFDNRTSMLTNAEVAKLDPSVNTQPRTINFIADYSLVGGEFSLEQALSRRVTLVAGGLLEEVEQKNLAPLQGLSAYQGKLRYGSFGGSLFLDVMDNLVLEGFSRWSKRSNRTPVASSSSPVRTYLLLDRNLSTPFLKTLSVTTFGGTATYYGKGITVRFGARQENSKRDFIRGIGSNAIPEGLTVYNPRSNPSSFWWSLGGRPNRNLRWSARYEYRTAEETWTLSDPGTAHRLRGSATLTNRSGMAGATLSFSYDDLRNDQFAFRTSLGSVPQLWDVQAFNAGIHGWYTASPRVQLHGGFQHMDREQLSNLVTTDVRRWRNRVVPALIDGSFGYDSSVQVWSGGATISLNGRVTLLPTLSWTDADGGINSSTTQARDFTVIGNDNLMMGSGMDVRLSERNRFHFRYGYGRYNDNVADTLSGRYHGLSFGLTRLF